MTDTDTDIVNRLRSNRECLAPCLMDDAAAEIERLRAERDEANKALAVYREFIGDEMMEAAKRRAGRG